MQHYLLLLWSSSLFVSITCISLSLSLSLSVSLSLSRLSCLSRVLRVRQCQGWMGMGGRSEDGEWGSQSVMLFDWQMRTMGSQRNRYRHLSSQAFLPWGLAQLSNISSIKLSWSSLRPSQSRRAPHLMRPHACRVCSWSNKLMIGIPNQCHQCRKLRHDVPTLAQLPVHSIQFLGPFSNRAPRRPRIGPQI